MIEQCEAARVLRSFWDQKALGYLMGEAGNFVEAADAPRFAKELPGLLKKSGISLPSCCATI